jgi:hypothetical protein
MNDHDLANLLQQADTPTLPTPANLPQRLRRIHHRRRTTRRALYSVLILLGALSPLLIPRPQPRPTAPPAGATLKAEIFALQKEADLRATAMDHILASQPAPRPRRLPPDPFFEIQLQQNQAAQTLLYTADRFLHDLHQPAAATAQYHRLVTLFPNTPAASTAKQRLEQL